MLRITLCIVTLCLPAMALAQPDTVWTSGYAGPDSSYDWATHCCTDSAGYLYVVGTTGGKALTIKYDPVTGDTIWARTNGLVGDTIQWGGCAADGEGHLYTAARSKTRSLIIKYQLATGDTVWTKVLDGGLASECAVSPAGHLFLAGRTADDDFWAAKCDTSGDTIWTRRYNVASNDLGRACVTDSLGNLYVVGSTYQNSNTDAVVIKYDGSTGDSLWMWRYNSSSNAMDAVTDCAVDPRGYLYVTGWGFNGKTSALIACLNLATGDTCWVKYYICPSWYTTFGYACAFDGDRNLYIVGEYTYDTGDDFLTIKYDVLDTATVWSVTYHGASSSSKVAYGCALDNSGGLYVAGNTGDAGNSDALILKYNLAAGVTGGPTIAGGLNAAMTQRVACSPSPFVARTAINYNLGGPGGIILTVYNAAGQRVKELSPGFQQTGPHIIYWDGTDQHGRRAASGMYFIRLITANGTADGKVVLLR